MNALVVEDDVAVGASICKKLKTTCFFHRVLSANTFEKGLEAFNKERFSTIVVDIGLNDENFDGLDLCRLIREKDKSLPIMVISGLYSTKLLKKAFELGVNEFMFKPFNLDEEVLDSVAGFN